MISWDIGGDRFAGAVWCAVNWLGGHGPRIRDEARLLGLSDGVCAHTPALLSAAPPRATEHARKQLGHAIAGMARHCPCSRGRNHVGFACANCGRETRAGMLGFAPRGVRGAKLERAMRHGKAHVSGTYIVRVQSTSLLILNYRQITYAAPALSRAARARRSATAPTPTPSSRSGMIWARSRSRTPMAVDRGRRRRSFTTSDSPCSRLIGRAIRAILLANQLQGRY